MSLIRFIIGLLVPGLFITGELFAFWYFHLPAAWILVVLMLFAAGMGGAI